MVKKAVQIASCLVAAISWSGPAGAQDARPNILVVLFDDVGFMDFGAYGSDNRTPNIDALAGKGTMLSRFYTSPFCGPSRAMLLTGLDNHQTGMGTLVETLSPEMESKPGYSMVWKRDQATIASLLSAAGYQTFVTGKWGIGAVGANLPHAFGFQRSYVMDSTGGSNYNARPYLPGYNNVDWFEDGKPVTLPEDFYSSRNLVDKLIGYIDQGDAAKPFFAFLSLQAIHIPVQAPLPFINAYDGVFDRGWDVMRAERHQRAVKLGLVPETTRLAAAPAAHRAWDSLSAKERAVAAREMQVNAGMVTAADFHIGRLLEHLGDAGKLDNTIVVITSDNGAESGRTDIPGLANLAWQGINLIEGFDTSPENLGLPGSLTAIGPEWAAVSSAPFNLYKFYASEGGLRVPLVVAGPGIAPQGIVGAPVHVADIAPTLLDAAGVAYDTGQFYGRSALDMLSGSADATYGPDESFAFEVSGNAAVYRGAWKITRNSPPAGDGQWRLHDLSVDPGEATDLSAANPEIFERMMADYDAYAQAVGVIALEPDDFAVKRLTSNLVSKSLGKYWPYFAGLFLALGLLAYGLIRLLKVGLRRRRAAA